MFRFFLFRIVLHLFYTKEHHDPQEDPDGYNSHWIRVEAQMRHEVAENAVRHIYNRLLSGRSVGESVAEMLGGHIQMIELDDSNISRCSISPWWTDFLETVKGVKITAKEEKEHVFERSMQWFNRSVAPLAATLIGGIGERALLELVAASFDRRSKAQINMLKVYKASPESKSGLDIFGNRVMQKIYRQWKKRMQKKHPDMTVDEPPERPEDWYRQVALAGD